MGDRRDRDILRSLQKTFKVKSATERSFLVNLFLDAKTAFGTAFVGALSAGGSVSVLFTVGACWYCYKNNLRLPAEGLPYIDFISLTVFVACFLLITACSMLWVAIHTLAVSLLERWVNSKLSLLTVSRIEASSIIFAVGSVGLVLLVFALDLKTSIFAAASCIALILCVNYVIWRTEVATVTVTAVLLCIAVVSLNIVLVASQADFLQSIGYGGGRDVSITYSNVDGKKEVLDTKLLLRTKTHLIIRSSPPNGDAVSNIIPAREIKLSDVKVLIYK